MLELEAAEHSYELEWILVRVTGLHLLRWS